MQQTMFEGLRSMRLGVVLALFGVLFGFGMGAAFGAAEEQLKGGLQASADAVLAEKYGGDAAKAKAVVDKSWSYYKRAHMHGGGIGAAALAVILLLAGAGAHGLLAKLAAAGMGFGALGYSVFWLLAGMRAPGMGGTGAAKDSLEWLAVPTSGAVILGLALGIFVVVKALFGGTKTN
jgi:hypothetical protein